MPLEKHPIEIPLGFYDMKPLTSAGPVGRLTTLQNATVQKFRLGTQTEAAAAASLRSRLQKRAGFKALSRTVYAQGVEQLEWNDPQLLATLGESRITVGAGTPYVYS